MIVIKCAGSSLSAAAHSQACGAPLATGIALVHRNTHVEMHGHRVPICSTWQHSRTACMHILCVAARHATSAPTHSTIHLDGVQPAPSRPTLLLAECWPVYARLPSGNAVGLAMHGPMEHTLQNLTSHRQAHTHIHTPTHSWEVQITLTASRSA
jgi:hypothetical protein